MKKLPYIGLCLAAVVALASCGNSSNKGRTTQVSSLELPQLTNNADAERLHLYFQLNETGKTDSSFIYHVRSLFKEDTVGFQVEVLNNLAAGVMHDGAADEANGFREGGIRISSLGAISDKFVSSLGTIMKLPTDAKMSSQTLLPLIFSSNKDSVDLSKSTTYSFKYFFKNGTGTPAELFGVIDTFKKSYELTEKDSTFRKAIIASFEGK